MSLRRLHTGRTCCGATQCDRLRHFLGLDGDSVFEEGTRFLKLRVSRRRDRKRQGGSKFERSDCVPRLRFGLRLQRGLTNVRATQSPQSACSKNAIWAGRERWRGSSEELSRTMCWLAKSDRTGLAEFLRGHPHPGGFVVSEKSRFVYMKPAPSLGNPAVLARCLRLWG